MTGEQRTRLARVRQRSLELIAPLEPEDLGLQGMADASPPKWHLGHTTWFFEQFLLRPLQESGLELGYEAAPAAWSFLFNSYYDAVGARHPRPQRGLLSRPPIAAVLAWRQRVDGPWSACNSGWPIWSQRGPTRWRACWSWGCSTSSSTRSCC
jgi:hypothetical protein